MENDKLKAALLGVLDKFIQVCEDNNLHYYMAYGSVLGAIRHKGLIPWDDDIDVHMPREDYEKIQQLPKSVWGDMELTSWKLKPNNQYHFLKLENPHTTVIEQLYPLYVGGVYIDIVPLDNAPTEQDLFSRQIKDILDVQKKYYAISVRTGSQCKGLVNYLKFQWLHYWYLHQHIQDKWERIATRVPYPTGYVFHSHLTGPYRGEKPMPQEWFGDGVIAEFEGRKVILPQKYEEYLTKKYGDYLTPPPIDQREGHAFVYINLDERISGEQLKKVIRELNKKFSFKFSLQDEINYWKAKLHL